MNTRLPCMELFGARLTMLRETRGYKTQSKMADALDLPMSTYSKYEGAYRFPRLDSIVEIANFFSVCPLWLIGSTDESNNPGVVNTDPLPTPGIAVSNTGSQPSSENYTTVPIDNRPGLFAKDVVGKTAKMLTADGAVVEITFSLLR